VDPFRSIVIDLEYKLRFNPDDMVIVWSFGRRMVSPSFAALKASAMSFSVAPERSLITEPI
jgi:hypothetical protein